ncbi:hypothetical protein C8J56DRAFT_1053971 [Mycena floridula]|nr:hypothetical protein C8J56DRAFT_1053971 [Mycena floridula]
MICYTKVGLQPGLPRADDLRAKSIQEQHNLEDKANSNRYSVYDDLSSFVLLCFHIFLMSTMSSANTSVALFLGLFLGTD